MEASAIRTSTTSSEIDDADNDSDGNGDDAAFLRDEPTFRKRAAEVYERYSTELRKRFKWLRPSLFIKTLETDLRNDADALIIILKKCGTWDAAKDAKLDALEALLTKKYPDRKVLIFTQFADTVHYVTYQLKVRGISKARRSQRRQREPNGLCVSLQPRKQQETRGRSSPKTNFGF